MQPDLRSIEIWGWGAKMGQSNLKMAIRLKGSSDHIWEGGAGAQHRVAAERQEQASHVATEAV